MEVKQAVATAKAYVADLLADEGVRDLGLEEIRFDESERSWNVTVGFSRSWNYLQAGTFSVMTGPRPGRSYRVVKVRDDDGRPLSMMRADAGQQNPGRHDLRL